MPSRSSGNDISWTVAGAVAAFVGVGIARFAYNPLFPAMVEAGWVEPRGGAYLGAFNFFGYLIGVLGSLRLAQHLKVPAALDLAMGVTALTFLGCAFDLGLAWFCLWRFLAGLSGGVLMVLAGPAVQAVVSPSNRGIAGGAVISGVGAGIVFGALAVPLLVEQGLAMAWLSLALLILALWGLTFRVWPRAAVPRMGASEQSVRIRRMTLVYGLSGAGMVPHMIYLSDLIVRDRGFSTFVASSTWGLFGLGAILGTIVGGRAVDLLGGRAAMRLWLAIQLAGLSLLMLPGMPAVILAGFAGGFAGVGFTAVVLGYSRELSAHSASANWRMATAGAAVFQAVGSLGFAALFGATHSHGLVVAAGWLTSALALALVWLPEPGRKD